MIHRNSKNTASNIGSLPYSISNFSYTIPLGSISIFQQTAAPVGWTKITTHNDKMLRLVAGTVSSGGTTGFSTVFTDKSVSFAANTLVGAATTLSLTQIPAHTHLVGGITQRKCFASGFYLSPVVQPGSTGPQVSELIGGGGSHQHSTSGTPVSPTLQLSVQYVDIILAQKN
jgi:hypothetical protein